MQSTIELVHYKIKAGVDPSQLNDFHPKLNAFVKSQPGFYYRTLVRKEDQSYLDIVHWESEEKAKAAEDKFMQQPWTAEFLSLLDEGSVKMERSPSVSEIGYDSP